MVSNNIIRMHQPKVGVLATFCVQWGVNVKDAIQMLRSAFPGVVYTATTLITPLEADFVRRSSRRWIMENL